MAEEEFREKHRDNPNFSKIEDLKESDTMRILNASYITERFFGKYRSWFSQKLNNHIKNGFPGYFTPSDIETLRNALYTISTELKEAADALQ